MQPSLERALDEALVTAREHWPGVLLTRERFIAAVLARLDEGGEASVALARLHATDLYLACACADGCPRALLAFERAYVPEVARACRKKTSAALEPAEVAQMLREKLFVGPRPKIEQYAGRGPLRLWVRMVVLRMVTNLATRGGNERPVEPEALAEVPLTDLDPELVHLRRKYRTVFADAFAAAIAQLGPADRALLRQHLRERITQAALARVNDVHVNTIAR